MASADVKHLPKTYLTPASPEVTGYAKKLTYLPPVLQEVVQKPNEETKASTKIVNTASVRSAAEVPAAPLLTASQVVVEKDSEVDSLTKEASKDPVYGFPGAFPPNPGFQGQGFPGQIYPGVVFPPQVVPGQGFPGSSYPPSAGYINPNFPSQGYPLQAFPGQGYPGQGFPVQSFPGQGFPAPGFPGSNFINPGFPGQVVPNYPVYFSTSEKLQTEANADNVDDKLRVRLFESDIQHDVVNGGYLYNKPSVRF